MKELGLSAFIRGPEGKLQEARGGKGADIKKSEKKKRGSAFRKKNRSAVVFP